MWFNKIFWENTFSKLKSFYDNCVVPEIVSPIHVVGLPVRFIKDVVVNIFVIIMFVQSCIYLYIYKTADKQCNYSNAKKLQNLRNLQNHILKSHRNMHPRHLHYLFLVRILMLAQNLSKMHIHTHVVGKPC